MQDCGRPEWKRKKLEVLFNTEVSLHEIGFDHVTLSQDTNHMLWKDKLHDGKNS